MLWLGDEPCRKCLQASQSGSDGTASISSTWRCATNGRGDVEKTIRNGFRIAAALTLIGTVGCGATAGEADNALKQAEEAYREGSFDAVVDRCTEAIRLRPGCAAAYYNRALAYARKREYGKAISDYTETIRLSRELADAYYGRGMAYERNGNHDGAIADYTEAIRLRLHFAYGVSARGNAYDEKGKHDDAIVDYTEAIRLDRNNPGVL